MEQQQQRDLRCRRCKQPARLEGHPGMPVSLRKAVHDDGSERCPGGELIIPVGFDLTDWP
jgi:hypothetical protein